MTVREFLTAATKRKAQRKRRKKREAIHEDILLDFCNSKGLWCIKLVFLFGKGWPDRTVLIPGGRIVFIEMKKDTDAILSPKQKEVRKRLKRLGFVYLVGYGAPDAVKKLKRYL